MWSIYVSTGHVRGLVPIPDHLLREEGGTWTEIETRHVFLTLSLPPGLGHTPVPVPGVGLVPDHLTPEATLTHPQGMEKVFLLLS